MYIIYTLIDEVWVKAAVFSQLVDAQVQLQRFNDDGIISENLKIEQE